MSVPVPPFASWMRNVLASPDNPTRDGMFVRVVRVPRGRMNPGLWFELTDGQGEFWCSRPSNLLRIEAPLSEAAAGRSDVRSRGRSAWR